MKAGHLFLFGAVAVGGFFAWKYRAKLTALVAPDPTVSTLAGATYGNASDVNGNIASAINGTATGDMSGQNDPTNPAMNAALTGSGAGLSYDQGAYA